ncbi:site-specific integrase [Chryseobacterium sp. JAH]|uniref:site-specific integrase n=1 Tax=Chryseobacterium sp. JAH TaxID=1742858 RepID=UPI00074139EE|nr:site-specific integrase [Chryseobacterium sp. JAH]KUJ51734.1 integrase [Chryseobacterium sp. JAH]
MKILFYIRKSKMNANNLCPLTCRITNELERKEFSTGIFINPDYWNASKQKAHPSNKGNNQVNTQLSLIKQEINQAFLFLQVQDKEFSVDDIYSQFKGENVKLDKSIKQMFQLHITKQEKLIGISTTKVSVAKFHQTLAHTLSFIKKKYNSSDYLLKDMTMAFITEFEFYLKTEKKFMQNTIYKTLQRFRQIIKQSVALDFLPKDPFLLYKGKKPKKEIVFLSKDELKNLEQHQFASERLQQVADMFIFCCYTGLAYTEMATLKESNIQTGFDDNKWLYIKRQKTKKSYEVPLLTRASDILDKYKNEDHLLPVVSNQRFNSYLKEIAEIVGIDKILTHHIARKTFASTILLFNNVPMEIVSELLGHSEIGITQQHYAKIVKEKVSEEMSKLNFLLK